MAKKPTAEAATDVAPMLALIDTDAPADSALVVVEGATPETIARRAASIVLLNPERFDQFYDRMRERTAELVPDVTTVAGRAAIRSAAFEVTKVKTTIDKAGLALTEDWRSRTKAVNDARKPMVQRLDQLAEQVRAPLTEWEAAEEARRAANDATMTLISNSAVVREDDTAQSVTDRGRWIYGATFAEPQWSAEEAAEAEGVKQRAVATLVAARKRLLVEEADRAELARLRAAELERLEREQAERVAREDAERIEAERVAAERAEAERVERERKAAEDAKHARELAEAAERARIANAATAAAEQAKREAEQAAEADRLERERQHAETLRVEREAREKAERDAQAERDREAARVAEEAARAAQAEADRIEAARVEAARVADRAHRLRVIGEAAHDIAAAGVDPAVAKGIALAIVSGSVRHCTVAF
jgi:hypothetical protein